MKKINKIQYFIAWLKSHKGFKNFNKQMRMHGIVSCKCGGQIISNTGKVVLHIKFSSGKICCWKCNKIFNATTLYFLRCEGEKVII